MNNFYVVTIFSGYNQRAVITFLRTLEKLKIKYQIIARDLEDTILLTSYEKHVISIRKNKKLLLSEILTILNNDSHHPNSEKTFIVPSTEYLNRFLLQNKIELEHNDCIVPLVPENLYNRISNKRSFVDLCKNKEITVPKEYKNLKDVQIPYVAKPKKYLSKNGIAHNPVIIKNEREHINFIKNFATLDFFYQDFIDGESFYLLYYFSKNKNCYKYSQENLVQQSSGKSMILAKSSIVHHDDISTRFERLFKSIDFFGLVMVEIKKHTNCYYMIEANPRLWGPSQLFVDSNINLFHAFLFDWKLTHIKPEISKVNNRYFWYGGYNKIIDNKSHFIFYNYTEKILKDELDELIKIDVYNKPDTEKIFNLENNYQRNE